MSPMAMKEKGSAALAARLAASTAHATIARIATRIELLLTCCKLHQHAAGIGLGNAQVTVG
jgi:hypothetical protein